MYIASECYCHCWKYSKNSSFEDYWIWGHCDQSLSTHIVIMGILFTVAWTLGENVLW